MKHIPRVFDGDIWLFLLQLPDLVPQAFLSAAGIRVCLRQATTDAAIRLVTFQALERDADSFAIHLVEG